MAKGAGLSCSGRQGAGPSGSEGTGRRKKAAPVKRAQSGVAALQEIRAYKPA